RDQIDADNNFFELGGHSLMAAEIVAALREEYASVDLTLARFFEAPTPAELSQTIEHGLAHEQLA
ncbi:MAG: acyl carrier protein, partial [Chloroflexi bacterium]|nr:acyl carrier protein [Chloroflexota bacterium]